jgi:hypothetical protein
MINSSPAGIRTQRDNGLLSQRKKPPTPLGSPAEIRSSWRSTFLASRSAIAALDVCGFQLT